MTTSWENIVRGFQELPADYRAELYAAELIRCGVPQEAIFFKTASSFHRPVGRDMESIRIDEREDGDTQLFVELNREGLYDMLPEGIFHDSGDANGRKQKTRESVLEDIRISRRQELEARNFFSPFENEFLHQRLKLELQERAINDAGALEEKRALFESLFGNASLLTNQQLRSLLHLLPIVHQIRGDLDRISYCLNLLIGYEVTIRKEGKLRRRHANEVPERLGKIRLGVSSIAGDFYMAYEYEYLITICGLSRQELPTFFEKGRNRRLLDYLLPYLLPATASWHLGLEVAPECRSAVLDEETNEMYLSINAYL